MNKGQITLVVLLTSTVILIIGAGMMSRSVTDMRLSAQLEESNESLSAAEAGIENGLNIDIPDPSIPTDCSLGLTFFDSKMQADCTVSLLGISEYSMGLVKKTESKTIWFVKHNTDGTLDVNGPKYNGGITIKWDPPTPVEFYIIYGNGANYDLDRTVVGAGTEIFLSASYANRWVFLRLKPLESDITVKVTPSSPLPAQGRRIESTGITRTGVRRKIIYEQWYPNLPALFDYAIFSYGNLEKN